MRVRGRRRGDPAPVRNCIFCGSLKLSDEHIFSKWTHRYLPSRKPGQRATSSVGTLHLDRLDANTLLLKGAARDWEVRCVCGGDKRSCNNGWMREIENGARIVMTPLICGNSARITPAEQRTVATWAALKATVVDFGDNGARVVEIPQREHMRDTGSVASDSWAIWIGHYERRRWRPDWISEPFLAVPPGHPQAHKPTNHHNSTMTVQIIGNLFIQTVYSPLPDFLDWWISSRPDNEARRGTLYRIWPPARVSVAWPGRALNDADADLTASALRRFGHAAAKRQRP